MRDATNDTIEDNGRTDPSTDEDDDSEEEDLSSYLTENLSRVYLEKIIATIDKLYRLSFWVRSPAMRIGLSRALRYTEKDPDTGVDLISVYAALDRSHLVDLFRSYGHDADNLEGNYLVQRLAKANTRRRQQFRYWRKRKAKFLTHSQPADEEAPRESHTDARPRQTISLNLDMLNPPHPELSMPSTATKLGPVNMNWDDDTSMTSTNTFVMMADDSKNADQVPIPSPPAVGPELKEFECPFCFTMCPRKTFVKGWETHIFRDLRPYVCTYKDCKEQDQQYDSLTDWITHEASKHRNVLGQPGHRQESASSRIREEHTSVPSIADSERECPFCLIPNANPSHVASHLRRIASFALPRWGAAKDNESEACSANSGKAELDTRGSLSDGFSLRSFSWDSWAEDADRSGGYGSPEGRGVDAAGIESDVTGLGESPEIPLSSDLDAADPPLHNLAVLEAYFDDFIKPLCIRHIRDPPIDQKTRDVERRRILEATTQQVLLKADAIDVGNDETAQQRKRLFISIVLELLRIMEDRTEPTAMPEPLGGEKSSEKLVQTPMTGDAERLGPQPGAVEGWVAWGGHEAVVKLLLEKGTDLESKDRNGRTPLSQAAWGGHEAVVKLLLEKGANLESKDQNGRTPLSLAAEKGHEAVVKLLLEKDTDLESKD